jgi:hypothetical protein
LDHESEITNESKVKKDDEDPSSDSEIDLDSRPFIGSRIKQEENKFRPKLKLKSNFKLGSGLDFGTEFDFGSNHGGQLGFGVNCYDKKYFGYEVGLDPENHLRSELVTEEEVELTVWDLNDFFCVRPKRHISIK